MNGSLRLLNFWAIALLFSLSGCFEQIQLGSAVSATSSTTSSSGTFIHPSPTITSITPNIGPIAGGTAVTLTGTGFFLGASTTPNVGPITGGTDTGFFSGAIVVSIGGSLCSSVTLLSSTTLTCVTGAASVAGISSVIVTNPDNQLATQLNGFIYQGTPPTLTQIAPTSGSNSGSTPVTLTGTGFLTGAYATIDGLNCNSLVVVSSTTITCITPAHDLGTVIVAVTNPDLTSASTLTPIFYTYTGPAPTISQLTPSAGGSGTTVSISGLNFRPSSTIAINGNACSNPTFINTDTLSCVTPFGIGGNSVSFVVTNPDGTSSVGGSNQYTYQFSVNQMASGGNHNCAVTNGGVQCWGQNQLGQLGNSATSDSSTPLSVTGISSGAQSVATGQDHSCAIINGGVQCWGRNRYGQLGNGSNNDSSTPVSTTGLTSNVQAITAGAHHTCAIKNGAVYCWGNNTYGQLGNNTSDDSSTPVSTTGLTSGVQAIAAGASHTCALITGGVQCWGNNTNGQLGNNSSTASFNTPQAVNGLTSGVQAIASGAYHSCALINGGVQCWGNGFFGQLGIGTGNFTSKMTPQPVSGLSSGVQAIAAGDFFTCALVQGGIQCWGSNAFGQLGVSPSTTPFSATPLQIPNSTSPFTGVQSLSLGAEHTCALINDQIQCWGDNTFGQLGNSTLSGAGIFNTNPLPVLNLALAPTTLSAKEFHVCATLSGGVQCWGTNSYGESGYGSYSTTNSAVYASGLASGTLKVAAGAHHTCALNSNITVSCWGSNDAGQVNGTPSSNSNTPTPVPTASFTPAAIPSPAPSVTPYIPLVAGSLHTCGIDSAYHVKCWGSNQYAQLIGSSGSPQFTEILSTKTIYQLTAGRDHTCALTEDGTGVYCWGDNSFGQLGGSNVTTPTAVPSVIPSPTPSATPAIIQNIAAGANHTCAILSGNGGVECWGGNQYGQLGNITNIGTTTSNPTPSFVTALTAATLTAANTTVQLLAAGDFHTCAIIGPSGTVQCWGSNSYGQLGSNTNLGSYTSTPQTVAGVTGARFLALGADFSCALNTTSVQCWGGNNYAQLGNSNHAGSTTSSVTALPVTNLGSGISMMTAGDSHTCTLVNGTIQCWGNNSNGQLGIGDASVTQVSTPQTVLQTSTGTALTGVQTTTAGLTSGDDHSCAIVSGAIQCWGANFYGQLGNGNTTNSNIPVTVISSATGYPPVSGAQAVSGGSGHTCAIINHGVQCWGRNSNGQLGTGNLNNISKASTVLGISSAVNSIATGAAHSCAALTGTGGVLCWGSNSNGQLGNPTYATTTTPTALPTFVTNLGAGSSVQSLAAGTYHTCALLTSGGVQCWGSNSNGQLGNNTNVDSSTPVTVKDSTGSSTLTGVSAINAGGNFTCATLTTGAVQCWGQNSSGQLGVNSTSDSLLPVSVKDTTGTTSLSGVQSVALGYDFACATLTSGGVQCWGDNVSGQLGIGSDGTTSNTLPLQVPNASSPLSGAKIVAAGKFHTCAVVEVSSLYQVQCWGNNVNGQLGTGNDNSFSTPSTVVTSSTTLPLTGAQMVANGSLHSCALINGGVQCWGSNSNGQLGNGSYTDSSSPISVKLSGGSLLTNVQAIAVGTYHSCALVNGGVFCWGYNYNGQLGNGNTTSSPNPQQVLTSTSPLTPLTGVQAIAVGDLHTCALINGGVQCWGNNPNGQLGNNTNSDSSTPVKVLDSTGSSPLSGVQAISAGTKYTCAIANGEILCWGQNTIGQLGNGSTTSSTTPQQVTGVTGGAQALSAGPDHGCAIVNGGIQCWGNNSSGQLGNNSTTSPSLSPTPVSLSTPGAQGIATGNLFSCALINGFPQCWGDNSLSQLGTGNGTSSLVPVSIFGF